jgi:hypothetical protein
MVILPSRPGINITVKCNGASLQEYEDEDEDAQPNVVTKYVEAISGAEFGVQWEIAAPWPAYTVLFDIYIDQKWVTGRFCKQVHFKPPKCIHLEEGALSVVNGQGFLHKFAFAALDVGKSCATPEAFSN